MFGRGARGARGAAPALWLSPRPYPDFAWGWATHFLVNLGNDLGTLYLLYFLAGSAHYHDPQAGLLILMALYAVALLAAGSVLGALSDRSGKRKPFIIGSAVTMAAAGVILSASPTWPLALVAAPLLGAGFGTYWAAAPALLTQVLPAAVDRGKDVGLINMAYNGALVVAPLAAGVVLGLTKVYRALFALAACRPRARRMDGHPRHSVSVIVFTKSIWKQHTWAGERELWRSPL